MTSRKVKATNTCLTRSEIEITSKRKVTTKKVVDNTMTKTTTEKTNITTIVETAIANTIMITRAAIVGAAAGAISRKLTQIQHTAKNM